MQEKNILVVWSNYYEELAEQQLDSCIKELDSLDYRYDVETVDAGTYEIPSVIRHFHKKNLYDGYIPLSLLLKGKTDHYEFIWEHVKECFIQFALDGILLGNGIISAPNIDTLKSRVENGERVDEAVKAIDYLLRLNSR